MSAGYQCPICAHITYGPHDVAQEYCPNCHAFTGKCTFRCDGTPTKVFGNVAACADHARELDAAAY